MLHRALVLVLLVPLVACHSEARAPAAPIAAAPAANAPPASPPRLEARVVGIIPENASNCGGEHVMLEAVVEGKVERLHAGGHCIFTTLGVGDTVYIDPRIDPHAEQLNPTWVALGPEPLPVFDGEATIVPPYPRSSPPFSSTR